MNSLDSLGGFLGVSGGPQANVQNGNTSLKTLNDDNQVTNSPQFQAALADYEKTGDLNSLLDFAANPGKTYGLGLNSQAMLDNVATGSTTGSNFATQQVQNNPILGSLFGKDGEMGKQEGILDNLQNQGFELKPEDQTLYGQEAGSIARQFGQQGNQTAQDLAARGLSNSGAAGAMFSGINGNQNEMLAQAQQQIAQQRFQNTQNQIAQQQSFVNSLGNQAANDINQQYGRQVQGAEERTGNLKGAAGLTTQQNQSANQSNLAGQEFDQKNKPANFMDYAAAGMGDRIYNNMAGNNTGGMGNMGAITSMFGT